MVSSIDRSRLPTWIPGLRACVRSDLVRLAGLPNPTSPYTNWGTTARTLQAAVDAAQVGDTVLATNGVYASGGRAVYGVMVNRVAVTKPVIVQSVNGPQVTVIQGYQVLGTTNGDGAVRCVYLVNGAVLSGFTLTNGATRNSGDTSREQSGGGTWCESTGALVTNCAFTANTANYNGGGAYSGTLNNCGLTGNLARYGGGAYSSTLNNCTITSNSAASYGGGAYGGALNYSTLTGNAASSGGGACSAALTNCTITSNSAAYGGGIYNGALKSCTLTGNTASSYGGGASGGALNNCAVAGNTAQFYGGGAYSATLSNCTLTGNSAPLYGGGASGGTLNNCTLAGNSSGFGGGAYWATLSNCALTGNSASTNGGGATGGTLNNCTLTGNSAPSSGGGAYVAMLNNCIVYYNTASAEPNYDEYSALNYCCTTPNPGSSEGNVTAEPQLANTSHLSASSPCRGAGSATYASGVDIDGEPWLSPPSIGCDEYRAGAVTGALTVAIGVAWTNVAAGFAVDLTAWIRGRASASVWDFRDGTVLSNQPYASHTWAAGGDRMVVLRAYNEGFPGGLSAAVTIRVGAPVQYVAADSTNPLPPYSSWATAARSVQDAVDAAAQDALVLVSNGVYASGGRVMYGAMTNLVAVAKPVTVQSANGSQVTVIQGFQASGTTNGDGAIRCVCLTNGAILSGFTLTNGATRSSGDWLKEASGGDVWCASVNVLVTNCALAGNSAQYGGAAYAGTLINCSLIGNSALQGGGAFSNTLINCRLANNAAQQGGGAFGGVLNNCTLTVNSATGYSGHGGGACDAALSNCSLTANSAGYGGGAYDSMLNNCILTSNSATWGSGGGAYNGTLKVCALIGNMAPENGGGTYSSTVINCMVRANSAWEGGGAFGGTVINCTLTGNSAQFGGGVESGTLDNCTLTMNSAAIGGEAGGCNLNDCIVYYNTAPNSTLLDWIEDTRGWRPHFC